MLFHKTFVIFDYIRVMKLFLDGHFFKIIKVLVIIIKLLMCV